MSMIRGSCSAEVAFGIERCWALVADIERAPEWQRTLQSVEVHERDDQGRVLICETVNDAKLRRVSARVRVEYSEPHRLNFSYVESDDLDDLDGGWELEALDAGLTRVTYALGIDPGPIPRFARPLERAIRPLVMGHQAEELARALAAGR
jgi:ribosome-associated toxin RatA of RatAB toxin-antitoxin module